MGRRPKSQSLSSEAVNAHTQTTIPAPATPSTPNLLPPIDLFSSSYLSPPASSSVPTTAVSTSRNLRIPPSLQFPLVILLSFSLSWLLFTLIAEYTIGDLASISRHTDSWAAVGSLLGWKVVQIGILWFGGLDAYDAFSLCLLFSTPYAILLAYFFAIRPTTLILSVLASAASASVPFALLRPLLPSHKPSTAAKGTIRNKNILTDPWTAVATSVLATGIFAVMLELAFATSLPVWLIVHFDHLRDLTLAHQGAAGFPGLLASLIPAGYAAREFIFDSSTGAAPPTTEYDFDPATAGFLEHVYYNAWGWYSNRQKELMIRTALLTLMVVAETVIQVWGTVEGAGFVGACGYAGMWGVGIMVVGAVFDWVGEPSG